MKKLIGLLFMAGYACASVTLLEAATIRIGIADDPAKKPDYNLLVDHLNKSGLGEFEFVFYPTVEALHNAFRAKNVRLALFGPVYYLKVHEELGAIPIVKDRRNASVIFVRRSSNIKTIGDLRGHRVAFGYFESTTSSMIPRMTLWRELDRSVLVGSEAAFKRNPQKVYYEYVGSHTGVIEAVISGDFDAGATVDVLFERNKRRGLRAIYTSKPYPGVPLVCQKDEDQTFIDQLRRAILSYKPPETAPHHHFKAGASTATDDDYEAIRYLCSMVLRKEY